MATLRSFPSATQTQLSTEGKNDARVVSDDDDRETLGEILEGNRLIDVGYDVHFEEDMPKTAICTMVLTKENAQAFKDAIDNMYYFQLYVDDLPVGSFVGTVDGTGDEAKDKSQQTKVYYLYNWFEFAVGYNKDRVSCLVIFFFVYLTVAQTMPRLSAPT